MGTAFSRCESRFCAYILLFFFYFSKLAIKFFLLCLAGWFPCTFSQFQQVDCGKLPKPAWGADFSGKIWIS